MQADVRSLLLLPQLDLDDDDIRVVSLEAQIGDGRRIDVEIGSAAIEIKKDLSRGRTKSEAIEQLQGYVEQRTRTTGTRYVGIITDGAEWSCYDHDGDTLCEVAHFDSNTSDATVDRLLVWLEGVLATAQQIPATSNEIVLRLGSGSSSHSLDHATIASLYARNRDLPTVRMKRALWSKLLTSTLGNQFEDTDDLFVEHTLLVNSAEIIAHSLLGLDANAIQPADLLSGAIFNRSSIFGVVEQDFFDWPLEVDGGSEFIRSLSRRLSRFAWANVDQDVLKTLYESVITPETRKRLGEYYTPDWLAQMVVEEVVSTPLETKVLDPACGSGTFIFHAVRRYIDAARGQGLAVPDILSGVSRFVVGMDLHPVAVTLARVPYLLAIGPELLRHPQRGPIYIPIYLGDSIQWEGQGTNLWDAGDLVVPVEDSAELFRTELRFPERLLDDAGVFDRLVEELAQLASRRNPGDRIPPLNAVFQRHGISDESRDKISATFETMCQLHDQGRNHIWSYYVRNLARPMWLSRRTNRMDALVGNPPWLAFRHMPEEMQAGFRAMEQERGLWEGAENATHQDLSALFVVRVVELFLRDAGRFGLVMPNAVVDRDHYEGFRTGFYQAGSSRTLIQFDQSWDLRRIRPHFFPRGSSVVFGSRDPNSHAAMPQRITEYRGTIPRLNTSLSQVVPHLSHSDVEITVRSGAGSPYGSRFRQGAIFSPRFLFFVDREEVGPLGVAFGQEPVSSSRSVQENKPWKELPSLEGMVESQFLYPLYTGDSLLPFRLQPPLTVIVPHDGQRLFTELQQMSLYPGLHEWWSQASGLWEENRTKDTLSLSEQLDYMSKLSNQFPIPPQRVIYNTAGMHLAAARLNDAQGIVTSNLYWCTVNSDAEAQYLCCVLNSPVTTEFVRPLMSYGKDERHIHKHVWKLPIPEYDASQSALSRLAELGAQSEAIAATLPIREEVHFSAQRRDIRNQLSSSHISEEIDQLVYEILS